jgi:hypothetical protein
LRSGPRPQPTSVTSLSQPAARVEPRVARGFTCICPIVLSYTERRSAHRDSARPSRVAARPQALGIDRDPEVAFPPRADRSRHPVSAGSTALHRVTRAAWDRGSLYNQGDVSRAFPLKNADRNPRTDHAAVASTMGIGLASSAFRIDVERYKKRSRVSRRHHHMKPIHTGERCEREFMLRQIPRVHPGNPGPGRRVDTRIQVTPPDPLGATGFSGEPTSSPPAGTRFSNPRRRDVAPMIVHPARQTTPGSRSYRPARTEETS